MKKRKLLVISNDSLVQDDLHYLMSKPFFKELTEKGSLVSSLKTVYPTITYCCHAAMITGCYPNKTGVYNNRTDEPFVKDYTWGRENIKVKTLVDAAKEQGYTTASVWWPCMGGDPNVDYMVPEYWSQGPEDDFLSAQARMGASEEVLREVIEPNLHYIKEKERTHPWIDVHIFACARDLLRKFNPDVMFVHSGSIDGLRHSYGVTHPKVTETLDITYYWLMEIVQVLKDLGRFEETDIILTSDHGHMNTKRKAYVNTLLEQNGFITRDENGKVTDVKAYAVTVNCSCAVYVKDGKKETYDRLHKLLCDCAESRLYGISRCYTREEADREEHLSGNFDFFLEGDDATTFPEGFGPEGKYFEPFEHLNSEMVHGGHGHHPDKGPQPCMVMIGPDFRQGVTVPRRSTLDMAATIAEIFGFVLPDMDGTVIEEVLEK